MDSSECMCFCAALCEFVSRHLKCWSKNMEKTKMKMFTRVTGINESVAFDGDVIGSHFKRKFRESVR